MSDTRSHTLSIRLAAGALAVFGAAGAIAAMEGPVGAQRAAVVHAAGDGGGPNPLCMVRPQDCMQPPGNGGGGGSGGGNGQPGSGGGSGSGG